MDCYFKTEGTMLTIFLPKELDHLSCEYIKRESDKIMGKIYIKTIQFDFSETTFMDSSGIGLIMGRYRSLGMRKGAVRAIHVGNYIERMLRMSGLGKYMEIWRNTEEDL